MTFFGRLAPSIIKRSALAAIQVCGFCLFAWACQSVATKVSSPIPGSVIGLAILLLLLCLKLVPEKSVNLGASWLIAELLLFFIPPVVGAIKYQPLLANYGVELITAMLVASTLVLIGTAYTVDKLFKFEHQQNLKRQQKKMNAQIIHLPSTDSTSNLATKEQKAA